MHIPEPYFPYAKDRRLPCIIRVCRNMTRMISQFRFDPPTFAASSSLAPDKKLVSSGHERAKLYSLFKILITTLLSSTMSKQNSTKIHHRCYPS